MNIGHILRAAMVVVAVATLDPASPAWADVTTYGDASAFRAASGSHTTVDFSGALESDSDVTTHSLQLTLDGVGFSVPANFIDIRGPQARDDTGSLLAAGVQFASPYLSFEQFNGLTITLPYAVKSFGFEYMNLFGFADTWDFEVAGQSFTGTSDGTPEFFGVVSDTPFTQIFIQDGEGFSAIADLTFDVAEPATLAVFGCAFAGLVVARRRRVAA